MGGDLLRICQGICLRQGRQSRQSLRRHLKIPAFNVSLIGDLQLPVSGLGIGEVLTQIILIFPPRIPAIVINSLPALRLIVGTIRNHPFLSLLRQLPHRHTLQAGPFPVFLLNLHVPARAPFQHPLLPLSVADRLKLPVLKLIGGKIPDPAPALRIPSGDVFVKIRLIRRSPPVSQVISCGVIFQIQGGIRLSAHRHLQPLLPCGNPVSPADRSAVTGNEAVLDQTLLDLLLNPHRNIQETVQKSAGQNAHQKQGSCQSNG